jgi:biotin-dependent carboxylase-like uncharacterized protein
MNSSIRQPTVKILEPGPFSTVQDAGRMGFRRFGVPTSGALDTWSLSQSNGLVGNDTDSAALEVFHGPIVLGAIEDFVVGYSGASTSVSVDGSMRHDNPLRIKTGSTLRLESSGDSAIVYLAFAGGLVVDSVMGSASTYTRAAFGGMKGRPLQVGDTLCLLGGETLSRSRSMAALGTPKRHRVIRGPHADHFSQESFDTFLRSEYHVSFDSDRMGFRLQGKPIKGFGKWGRVLTFPVFQGMVQVSPDGLPIVLMADCQTTGGYPVIAVVLAPDLCALAQKFPGSAVSFEEVSEEEADRIDESFTRAIGLGHKRAA